MRQSKKTKTALEDAWQGLWYGISIFGMVLIVFILFGAASSALDDANNEVFVLLLALGIVSLFIFFKPRAAWYGATR